MAERPSVIIVNWHSEALLADVLAALDRQTLPPGEVIIVDNGSRSALPVGSFRRGPVHVLSMPGNVGFAAANNRAIFQLVQSPWVALLNPDAVPEPEWLDRLMAAARDAGDVAAFASRQLMAEDHARLDGLGDVYHVSGAAWRDGHGEPDRPLPATPREVFSPCAAAALYRREALIAAGGFDEDFFCYLEDVDLGFRLRLLGYRCLLVPGAVVYHMGSATSGGRRSDFSVFHGQRNLVWTYFKNMPARQFWAYLPQHLLFNIASLVHFTLQGQGRVIFRSKWAACRGLPRMIRKRRLTQSGTPADRAMALAAMTRGWLRPYRRARPDGRPGTD